MWLNDLSAATAAAVVWLVLFANYPHSHIIPEGHMDGKDTAAAAGDSAAAVITTSPIDPKGSFSSGWLLFETTRSAHSHVPRSRNGCPLHANDSGGEDSKEIYICTSFFRSIELNFGIAAAAILDDHRFLSSVSGATYYFRNIWKMANGAIIPESNLISILEGGRQLY